MNSSSEKRESGRKRFVVRALLGLLILLLLLPLVYQLVCLYYYLASRSASVPQNLGNFPRIVASLPEKGPRDRIHFAAVGDARRYGILEGILESVGGQRPDFVVLLGDMVPEGSPESHRLFQQEMGREVKLRCPTFYVVGNHDIDEKSFPLEKWESVYGPSQFWFKYGDSLFIFTHIVQKGVPPDSPSGCDFLEDVLKSHAAGAKKIFVFNHIPPPVGAGWGGRRIEEAKRLLRVLEKYEVSYFIAGDYHGYADVETAGTEVVVSGGGGSSLKAGAYGFYHASVFAIYGDKVQQRLIVGAYGETWEDALEHVAVIRATPLITGHKIAVGVADAALVALIYFLLRFWRSNRAIKGSPA